MEEAEEAEETEVTVYKHLLAAYGTDGTAVGKTRGEGWNRRKPSRLTMYLPVRVLGTESVQLHTITIYGSGPIRYSNRRKSSRQADRFM